MNALQVHLPASLRKHLSDLAERQGVSVDQFIATAVAEKRSALLTEEYHEARAQRGRQEKYETALGQVPDVEPEDYDRP